MHESDDAQHGSLGRLAFDKAKDIGKMYARRALKQIAKKLLRMLVKLLLKMVGKFILGLVTYFGVPITIILIFTIIIGGGIIYEASNFGWLDHDPDGQIAQKLKSQYESAVAQTSDLPEYRPPILLVQAIDNVRITKNDLQNTSIDPSPIANALKPDLTYKDFTNTTTTTTTHHTTETVYDDNGNPHTEEHLYTTSSTSNETVSLLVKAHAWNRIETITYHQETTTQSSGDITVTKTFWVRDTQACAVSTTTGSGGANNGAIVSGPSGMSHPIFMLYGPAATEEERISGIPAAVTLAQLVQESGWQPSELALKYYNFFGIKTQPGDGWTGPVVEYNTSEQDSNGNFITIRATFRVYANATEGFHGHSEFLLENGRYKSIIGLKNPYVFANGLQAAGYATDINYAYNLRALIHEYNLGQYDVDKGIDPATGNPYEDVGYSGPIVDISGGLSSGCGTPDFTKFDSILQKLDFTSDDAAMTMIAVNEVLAGSMSGYNGFFMEAYKMLGQNSSETGSSSGTIADAPVIAGSTDWIFPTFTKALLGSPFGWRYDDTKGNEALHKGQDIIRTSEDRNNNVDYPIYAVSGGIVEWAGLRNDGYGYSVLINHGNGIRTRYAHMVAGSLQVTTGDHIQKGKSLGIMGQTGLADGVHLHFEVLIGDDYTPVNPISYLQK